MFTLVENGHPQRRRTVCAKADFLAVEQSIDENSSESIRQHAPQLKLGSSTLWKILRKNQRLRACKIQIVREMKPATPQARRTFVE